MNTQLIYVDKESAEVSNSSDGSFTNAISEGVIVKQGDAISLEGIAINSISVGSEVIEIPETVKNYPYKTNGMKMNCWFYIHHNYQFTVSFPLAIKKEEIYTTLTDANYGYYKSTDFDGASTFFNLSTLRTQLEDDFKNAGKRYYVGCFNHAGTPNAPAGASTITDPVLTPNYARFEFLTTDIEFQVDTGYDTPTNIANKITADFHSGTPSPQYPNLEFLNAEAYYEKPISFSGGGLPYDLYNLSVSNQNGAVNTTYAFPRPFNNPDANLNSVSLYQTLLGVQNPYYYYWGSRLLSSAQQPKHNAFGTSGIFINPLHSWNIVSYNTLPNNGTDTDYNDGFVVCSNLPYDESTLGKLREFIHSQKQLPINTGNTESVRTTDKEFYRWNLLYGRCNPLGRTNDGTGLDSPYIGPLSAETFFSHYASAFYNEAKFNSQYINEPEFTLLPNYIINYKGVDYTAKNLAKILDIMIVPVDTGVNGNNEINVGFILNRTQIGGEIYLRGNNILVDFSPTRKEANCVMLVNPNVRSGGSTANIDDYSKVISLGTPDMNMLFDETRGRFAFNNMSWANYIGSGDSDTAVATADQEVITANAQNVIDPQLFSYRDATNNDIPNAFTKYAQSGVGIHSLSVINPDGTSVIIDKNSSVDIKSKYQNSLLSRMGFDYYQIIDDYGIPSVIFDNRTYQTKIIREYPTYFPFPFTTNAEFDTAINESLSVNNNSLPLFDLQLSRNITNVNIASSSAKAYANRAPKKLAFPYWLVKTDIIDGINYTADGKPQNILGVCNRSYTSGDFAFSFNTDYNIIATHDFVLTGIKTSILNPDLTPATIDSATAVIYKIVSPNAQLQANQIAQEIAQEERNKKVKSQ
jgi:hypothetical protein